jgi:hypothetical protein
MRTRRPFQFSLLSLLLAVAIFAVICSSWKMTPLIGILTTVAALYGSLALWADSEDAALRGEVLTYRQKLRAFFETAAVIVFTAIGVIAVGLVIIALFSLFVSGKTTFGPSGP